MVDIDRLVATSGRREQRVVSDLLSDRLEVGRIDLADPADPDASEVMTLAEAAALLRLPEAETAAAAGRGELPGRLIGREWRFRRAALLGRLGGEPAG